MPRKEGKRSADGRCPFAVPQKIFFRSGPRCKLQAAMQAEVAFLSPEIWSLLAPLISCQSWPQGVEERVSEQCAG